MKKILLFLSIVGFSFITNACDFEAYFSYTVDYIAKVNNIPVVTMNANYDDLISNESYDITVKNDIVVDSPLTVECQLFNHQSFYIKESRLWKLISWEEDGTYYDEDGNIIDMEDRTEGFAESGYVDYETGIYKLQYRVLPDGEWITVNTYKPLLQYNDRFFNFSLADQGSALFGKNNIDLSHLKAGTVIMIRLYTENSRIASGDEEDLCDYSIVNRQINRYINGNNYFNILPNTAYNLGYSNIFLDYDYDNQEYTSQPDYLSPSADETWKPHNCITVIYSGNERPIR